MLNSATRPTPTSGRRRSRRPLRRSVDEAEYSSEMCESASSSFHSPCARQSHAADALSRRPTRTADGAIRSTAARLTSDQRCILERGASESAIELIARLAGACATEQSHAKHTQQRRRDTLESRSADKAASIRAMCEREESARAHRLPLEPRAHIQSHPANVCRRRSAVFVGRSVERRRSAI